MSESFVFEPGYPACDGSRAAMRALWLSAESECIVRLLPGAELDESASRRVQEQARRLVARVRGRRSPGSLDAFLEEYDLSTGEGVVLMCLAEALLRIPDAGTADRLIRGLLSRGEWEQHLGKSPSFLVNASTWSLVLTGRLARALPTEEAASVLERLAAGAGETVLRLALRRAMEILARAFVMGETIEAALARARNAPEWRYSFDMLGEAAMTRLDADRYLESYVATIRTVGQQAGAEQPLVLPGVSVKLSALHPRYEFAQRARVLRDLGPKLSALAHEAHRAGVMLTVDAEEADRLELSLDLFELAFADAAFTRWDGLGLAVQAYQKRAPAVIDWLAVLARRHRRRIPLRLVKGAYWDSEVKRAQVQGLEGYPVYTRKAHTDVAFLACGRLLLADPDCFHAQFATHNAHTVAHLLQCARDAQASVEFQRLHGMGAGLYQELVEKGEAACRVYAPVGGFATLLPYLVRRLLENGANTSFVNRIAHAGVPVDEIVANPSARLKQRPITPHPRIPLPRDLYGVARRNAAGMNLADPDVLSALKAEMEAACKEPYHAAPIVGGQRIPGIEREVREPADRRRLLGTATEAGAEAVEQALSLASHACPAWDVAGAEPRACALERAADLFELHCAELMTLLVREAGKTLPDALSEVREAVDFFRYYASEARLLLGTPQRLPGPSGEDNRLVLRGRGVFACISPWNFPLAIFVGQVVAALAAGNSVVAKPAEQTPLTAMRAAELLHEAGVPVDVLHLLPGSGETVGAQLVGDPRVAGVAFTGSTETARRIQHTLAARAGPMVPLIAETGGMNAMIADSSALPEQLVADVLTSAFNSAGQRCSALRLLFLQEELTQRVLEILQGAIAELVIGDPGLLVTDVGPVIDDAARAGLEEYAQGLARQATLIATASLPAEAQHGCYFAPRAFEIGIDCIPEREVFGPILHVIRWKAGDLDRVIDAINATGYGLTLGVHSRLEETAERVQMRARAGNLYVNRNIIGAVVGVQPFGGEGLSGTGPKAGGPHYLPRFSLERTVSVNTAAVGGNASLLALDDEA